MKKIGDKIEVNIKTSSKNNIRVKGKIKDIKEAYGTKTYLVEKGVCEDFYSRSVVK